MPETRTDVDSAHRSTLLTELAIRPLLRHNETTNSTCGLCGNPLTRLDVCIEHHELTVLVCSDCSWHTRLIDGQLATASDLAAIAQHPGSSADHPLRGADAVTWYCRTNRYRG